MGSVNTKTTKGTKAPELRHAEKRITNLIWALAIVVIALLVASWALFMTG